MNYRDLVIDCGNQTDGYVSELSSDEFLAEIPYEIKAIREERDRLKKLVNILQNELQQLKTQ